MPAKDLIFRFIGEDAGAGREFDRISGKASKTQGLIGKFALGFAAAGATIAAVSVKMADQFETADARMRQAFKNTGHSADQYKTQIATISKQMEHLGFTNAQTETGLGTLATALRSPTKAFKDIALAADLARFKNVDLGTAALAVAKAEEGQLRPLKQLGIDLPITAGGAAKLAAAHVALTTATDHYNQLLDLQHAKHKLTLADHIALENAQGKVATAQQKVNTLASEGTYIHEQLAKILGGQASAAAATFAGKEAALKAQLTDVGVKIGLELIPILSKLVTFTSNDVVPALDKVGAWAKNNSGWLKPLAESIAGLAVAYKALKLAQGIGATLGKIPGISKVAGELGVQKVYVVNWQGGAGGFVKTAEKDAENVGKTGVAAAAAKYASRASKFLRLAPEVGVAGGLAFSLATVTDKYHGNPLSGFYPLEFTRAINSLPRSQRAGAAQDYLASAGLNKPLGSLDALKRFQSNPAEMAAVDKWLQKWGTDLNGVSLAAKQSANDIDNEKSSLAALRDEIGRHDAAVAGAVAAIRKIPGAYAQAAAQAKAQGISIGAALDAGITIGIKQGGGTINLVTKQLVNGVLHTHSHRASAFASGGWVTGGTPGRDSVPAMLTPGEFVVTANRSNLKQLIAARNAPAGGTSTGGGNFGMSDTVIAKFARAVGEQFARANISVNATDLDGRNGRAILAAV